MFDACEDNLVRENKPASHMYPVHTHLSAPDCLFGGKTFEII